MPKIGENHQKAMMLEAAQRIASLRHEMTRFIDGIDVLGKLIKEANELLKTLKSLKESETYYADTKRAKR